MVNYLAREPTLHEHEERGWAVVQGSEQLKATLVHYLFSVVAFFIFTIYRPANSKMGGWVSMLNAG